MGDRAMTKLPFSELACGSIIKSPVELLISFR
jgi:hypothetical protein